MVEIRVVIKPKQEETKLHKMPEAFDIYNSLFSNADHNEVLEISDLLPKACIYKPDIPGILLDNSDEGKLDRKILKKALFISEKALKEINIDKFYESLLTKYKSDHIKIDASSKIISMKEENIKYDIDEKIRPIWNLKLKVSTNQICYFPCKDTLFQFFIILSKKKLEEIKALKEIELCNGIFNIESINEIKNSKSNRAVLLSSYLPKDVTAEIKVNKSFFRVKIDSENGNKIISSGGFVTLVKKNYGWNKTYYYCI